jgi:hypothetical protein
MWNYESRIAHFRADLGKKGVWKKCKGIYDRAEKVELRGSKQFSMLFAHLLCQSLYLENRNETKLYYEWLCRDGNLVTLNKSETFNMFSMKDETVFNIDRTKSASYKIHGTKNPTNPYGWVQRFTEDDLKMIGLIAGKALLKKLIPDDVCTLAKELETIPQLGYAVSKLRIKPVSTRLVTISDYCSFLNELVSAGVNQPHESLCVNASYHTISFSKNRYAPRRHNAPMVLVSPLGALAYSAYHGARIPDKETYRFLNDQLNSQKKLVIKANHSEIIGSTTIPGYYTDIDGYFDLHGNVREITIDAAGECWCIGGSYRDEIDDLLLSRTQPIPVIYRDTDIGFRLQYNDHITANGNVVNKIKEMASIKLYK